MPDVNEDETDRQWEELRSEAQKEEQQSADDQIGELLRKARSQQRELVGQHSPFPYKDGDLTVLGPEIFASGDGSVLSWKGENYVPQEQVKALSDLRTVAGIHCGALGELLHDSGVRMSDGALRIYMLLLDELTLTVPALAEQHSAAMPRVPKGME